MRILGGEIDRVRLLAGAVDDCRSVAAGHERQAVTGGQGVEQGLGPQVLVDVGRGERGSDGAVTGRVYSTNLIEFLYMLSGGSPRGAGFGGMHNRAARTTRSDRERLCIPQM